MNVQLARLGQVKADHETDLLNVEASPPDIRGNQHSALARSELLHDSVSLFLRHAAMHAADRKVCFAHLLRQPFGFLALVAEDDGLRDSQRVVQVAQCLELELFSFHSYEKLLDALECQLVALD